jgi:prefoldin subunit 5
MRAPAVQAAFGIGATMKFDSAVKDLQKEKQELESKLKQVNVALAALTKLAGKPDADA